MRITAKVVVLGAATIGKTCIINYSTTGKFNPDESTTVGAAFSTKTIDVGRSVISLQIWDTAGQEKFRSLAPMYYHGAQVALLVFDLTNHKTLSDARRWATELRQHLDKLPILYLIGNKYDLIDKREVPENEAQETANELKAFYFETSALTGYNIDLLFQDIAEQAGASGEAAVTENVLQPALQIDPAKRKKKRKRRC
jgi:Ras-related protein Rab-5C